MKSAERYRNSQADESCPEVDGVFHMPEVYKIPMVRMKRVQKLFWRIFECTGLYRDYVEMHSDTSSVASVGE